MLKNFENQLLENKYSALTTGYLLSNGIYFNKKFMQIQNYSVKNSFIR